MRKNQSAPAALFVVLVLTGSAFAQPTLSKVFTPNFIGPGSVSTITFTITNGSASTVTELSFTDSLPGPMTIADPASVSTNCDLGLSGFINAPDGGSTITLSNAQIGGSQSCTITVDVTASTPGAHTNPAVTLSSSAGSRQSLPVDLTVDSELPGFKKSFSPSMVVLGGRTTITFTISSAVSVLNLDFTDTLTGMIIASPSDAATTCGTASVPPTLTAVPGTSTIILDADGISDFPALGADTSCTVTVDVIATTGGDLPNVTEELLAESVSAGKASASLMVSVTPVLLTKSFSDDPIPPGGTATLEFSINNFDRNFSATGVAFTDDLTTLVPALPSLTFDSLLSNDCGGSVSGGGGTTIGFSGGTIGPESSCTIRVSLAVPVGALTGAYTNTTGTVTATVGGSPVVGNMASDDLFVIPAPIFTKEFIDDPVTGGSTVTLRFTITNTDPSSSLTGIAFEDDIGGAESFRMGVIPGLAANGLVSGQSAMPMSVCNGGEITVFDPPDPTMPPAIIPADPTLLIFTGGSLAPAGMVGDSCTFDVILDVPSGVPSGTYPNMTTSISAMPTGGPAATDNLIIVGAPILTKEFTDDPVAPGGTVTLSFTLSHPAEATTDATDISFTDDLNALGIASLTANLPPSPDPPCGAGSSLTAPGNVLTLTDGSLMPGEDCTFSLTLDIPAVTSPANFTNTTSEVSATVDGLAVTSAAASDILKVSGLTFSKEFLDDPAIPGDTVRLRFTITNIHPTDDASGISFSDDLADVLPGTPDLSAMLPGPVNTCGGMMSGTTVLSYSGGSVLAGMTCMIELDVLVPAGAADGTYGNITGNLTATQGGAVTVDPASDSLVIDSNRLQLTKTFTDDPVAPGDAVTLEFVLTNLDSAQAASGIAFTDNLAAALSSLTFDSVLLDTCGGTVGGTGTDMITVSGVSLAASGSCTLRVSLMVPGGSAAGVYTNTTDTVTGTLGGFPVTGDAASDDLEVVQLLVFSKSFDGPTTATGMATLTFTITNPGTNPASDISFSDDLDSVISGLIAISLPAVPCGAGSSITGISFLSFSGGELPPLGGMCSFDVDVLVPVSATAGLRSNVTSGLFQSGLQVAEPATADLTIEPPPTFAKAFSPDVILAGGVSTLTFTIDNQASALAASSLSFVDNLPAGVVIAAAPNASTTCSGGTLTAMAGAGTISYSGGSLAASGMCTVQVDVSSVTNGTYSNTTEDLSSSSGNSGTASDTLTVSPAVDLSVSKSDTVTSATPGGSLTYTIVATNNGPSMDPSVSLTDAFPSPPLTCTYTSVASGLATGNTAAGSGDLAETLSMPAGSSVTYTVSCDIDSDATGTLSNTATVSASVTELVPGNNSATDADTILSPEADLSITKDDTVTSAVPGESLSYTIVASNDGPSDDPNVSVSDTFPADLTCTYTSVASGLATGNTATGTGDLSETLNLPKDTSVTYTVSCDIDAGATGTLSNTASISGSVTDRVSGNNSATDGDTVLTPEADLSLVKDDGGASVVPGTNITFTLTVTNNGPSDSTGGSISDTLPSGLSFVSSSDGCTESGGVVTCPVPAIANGDNAELTFIVNVDAGQTSAITNNATVTGNETDPSSGNNTGTDGTPVLGAEVDLTVEKDDGVTSVVPGGSLTYTLTVTNNGPSDSSGGTISDTLPAGLTFVSSADGCSETGGVVTCSVPAIANGSSADLTFVVMVDGGQTSEFTNSATVTANETDPEGGNNDGSHVTRLAPGFSKSFSLNPISLGGVSTLTFVIDNTANSIAATSLAFTDDLPGGMTVATPNNAATACGGTLTATAGSGSITLSGGTAASAGSCTISVDVTSSTAGESVNTTGNLTSSLGTGGTATDTLVIVDGILMITKAFVPTEGPGPAALSADTEIQPLQGAGSLMAGDLVDLEYTITNTSAVFSLTQIAFTDDLGAVLPGLVAVGLPIANQCGAGSNTSGTALITFADGSLAPSSSCTFRVTIQIPASAPPGTYPSMTSPATGLASGALVTTPDPAVADLVILPMQQIPLLSNLGLLLMAGLLGLVTWRMLLGNT